MINRWQIGDQIQDHNRGASRFIQKLLVVGGLSEKRYLWSLCPENARSQGHGFSGLFGAVRQRFFSAIKI
jgi:hypothetical protein